MTTKSFFYSPSQVFQLSPAKLQEVMEGLKTSGKEKLRRVLPENQRPHIMEKIYFTAGVANIFITAMALSLGVREMAYWYTLKFLVMISCRLVQYRKKLYHYFLFDFCYYANILLLAYLWLFPSSLPLFTVVFAFANGPLAFAVPLWKNALVFHSLDRLTSCFIHISPAFMTWALLWRSSSDPWFQQQGFAVGSLEDLSFADFFIYGMPVYLVWQLFYLFRVEFLGSKRVKDSGYMTSRVYMSKRGFIATLTKKWPNLVGKELVLFVGFQFFYTLVTIAPAYLWRSYQSAHTLFLTLICLRAAWNGADYYFQVMRLQAEQAASLRFQQQQQQQSQQQQ